MKKNLFFPKETLSIVFRDTFSCELFQYFHSTHGKGGPGPARPRRGRAREAENKQNWDYFLQETYVFTAKTEKTKKGYFFNVFRLFDFFKFRPGPGGSILIQSLVFLSWFTASKNSFFQHFSKNEKWGLSIHSLPPEVVKKDFCENFIFS